MICRLKFSRWMLIRHEKNMKCAAEVGWEKKKPRCQINIGVGVGVQCYRMFLLKNERTCCTSGWWMVGYLTLCVQSVPLVSVISPLQSAQSLTLTFFKTLEPTSICLLFLFGLLFFTEPPPGTMIYWTWLRDPGISLPNSCRLKLLCWCQCPTAVGPGQRCSVGGPVLILFDHVSTNRSHWDVMLDETVIFLINLINVRNHHVDL